MLLSADSDVESLLRDLAVIPQIITGGKGLATPIIELRGGWAVINVTVRSQAANTRCIQDNRLAGRVGVRSTSTVVLTTLTCKALYFITFTITPHMFPHNIPIGFVKSMKWKAYMPFLMTDSHFRSDARPSS